jgi:hypothetical protein
MQRTLRSSIIVLTSRGKTASAPVRNILAHSRKNAVSQFFQREIRKKYAGKKLLCSRITAENKKRGLLIQENILPLQTKLRKITKFGL